MSISSQPDTGRKLSEIFFVSILAAAGIYAVAIAIESVSAGYLIPGLTTLAILVGAIAATAILHIPTISPPISPALLLVWWRFGSRH